MRVCKVGEVGGKYRRESRGSGESRTRLIFVNY